MKKINKLINTETTRVIVVHGDCFRKVTSINDNRTHIKVKGLIGSFQQGHILKFTNQHYGECKPN